MAIYTFGTVTDIFAAPITELTHPQSEYSPIKTPTAGALWVEIELLHAFIEAVANTNPGSFIIQKTLEATRNDRWIDIAQFTVTNATAASEALTAIEPVAETVLAVAATAGFAPDDDVFVRDASVVADSEWHKLDIIVTNVSLDIVNGLRVAKDSADTVFGSAERFSYMLDLSTAVRWRVLYKHEGSTGANVAIAGSFREVLSIG